MKSVNQSSIKTWLNYSVRPISFHETDLTHHATPMMTYDRLLGDLWLSSTLDPRTTLTQMGRLLLMSSSHIRLSFYIISTLLLFLRASDCATRQRKMACPFTALENQSLCKKCQNALGKSTGWRNCFGKLCINLHEILRPEMQDCNIWFLQADRLDWSCAQCRKGLLAACTNFWISLCSHGGVLKSLVCWESQSVMFTVERTDPLL